MFSPNRLKLVKNIFWQGINNNNIKRYYASTIQLPFHPHYVPPGQPSTIMTTSNIRKQKKKTKKTSNNSSITCSFNDNEQQSQTQIFILKNPANSMIFQLGLVPTINRLQETSFSKREDILLSMNFFGDTCNEKRKIPFLFRISTICFIIACLARFYRQDNDDNNNNNQFEEKSI